MRFFIALEIPKENLAQFKAIQDSLHTLIPQARLTALDKIHLPTDERRFIPHISLAKLNKSFFVDRNLERELEKIMAAYFEPIQVSSIKLFESIRKYGHEAISTLLLRS